MPISAPHWDLSNVYPSLESEEFKDAVDNYKKQVAAFEKFAGSHNFTVYLFLCVNRLAQ